MNVRIYNRQITKKVFFLVVCICLPVLLVAQDKSRLPFLLDKLYDGGKSRYAMIFAHRGDWKNAPENSLPGFQNCIDRQIDGIEIDVRETKDGHIVIMHDETVNRTTNGAGKIKEMSLAEIKMLKLKTSSGVVGRQQVPTFSEVLLATKGKVLIQVDKWQPVLQKVLLIAEEHDCLDQLIFRGTKSAKEVKETFGDYYSKVQYIPVINADGIKDNEKLDDFISNLKPSTIGVAFREENPPIFNRVAELHEKGIRLWYNSLVGAKFNAGHDDQMAERDLINSYGWLLKKGADVIMTDSPFLLLEYLKNNNRR